MECLWCGKKIGFFRRILDKEFCSSEHRRLATLSPEGVVFDQDATADYDTRELWTVEKDKRKGPKKSSGVVVFVAIGAVAVLMVGLSDGKGGGNSGGGGGSAVSIPSIIPNAPAGAKGATQSSGWSLGSIFQSRATVTLTHDFASGLGDWVSSSGTAVKDWSLEPSGLRAGSLKIWKRSSSLSNYDMEFVGQIEQKSMNWAFRATDSRNYYATKLSINRPVSGSGAPNAGIVRYAMLDGKEVDRIRLPLPISLERGRPYRVRVSVQGTRFITAVNGRTVSSWSDHRISKGGVGFFSEEGESATVRWVSLSERDSTLGRLLSHFAVIQPVSAFYPASFAEENE
jgi:hypothetical protein